MGVAVGMAAHLGQGIRARQQQARGVGSAESMVKRSSAEKALAHWFRQVGIHETPSFVGLGLAGMIGTMVPVVYGWGPLSGVGGLLLGLLAYIGILRDRWNRKLKLAESQMSGLLALVSV